VAHPRRLVPDGDLLGLVDLFRLAQFKVIGRQLGLDDVRPQQSRDLGGAEASLRISAISSNISSPAAEPG
jgi:hypothetical protein